MYNHWRNIFITSVMIIATGICLSGCEETGINTSGNAETLGSQALNLSAKSPVSMAGQHPQNVNKQLAALRRATAPFHNIDKAIQADYDTPITSCWYHSELGAMGYHYGNLEYLENGEVDLLRPEALMYEPGPGGHYRLVGMEYIVPVAAWEGAGNPTLLGQQYHLNEALGLYTLHIWLWRDNPAGLFANWNPKVTCDHAEESEDRAGM